MSSGVLQASEQQTKLTLIIGDETFTFVPAFLESHHCAPDETVEVASCLPEDKITDEFRPNYLALIAQRITIHFGVNPAQLKNYFFNNHYHRIIVVLPGIAFTGFPIFIDRQHSALFKLRIHMLIFSFLKSSKNALQANGLIQFVWPKQHDRKTEFVSPLVPWHPIDIPKIGPFCEVFRSETEDEVLDSSAFQEWHPLIHNEPKNVLPTYLNDCVFYSWRLTSSTPEQQQQQQASGTKQMGDDTEDKDTNLLFVPPEIWNHSVEVLPHVNMLLKFEMLTHNGTLFVVSKPTLKFDPRFRSDGGPAKNPYMKRMLGHRGNMNRFMRNPPYNMAGMTHPIRHHPPPPPPDLPPEMFLGGFLPPTGNEGNQGIVPRWYEGVDPMMAAAATDTAGFHPMETLPSRTAGFPDAFYSQRYTHTPYGPVLRSKMLGTGASLPGDRFLGNEMERHHHELGGGLSFDMDQRVLRPGEAVVGNQTGNGAFMFSGNPVMGATAEWGYQTGTAANPEDMTASAAATAAAASYMPFYFMANTPAMTAAARQHDDVLLYERMELGLPFECRQLMDRTAAYKTPSSSVFAFPSDSKLALLQQTQTQSQQQSQRYTNEERSSSSRLHDNTSGAAGGGNTTINSSGALLSSETISPNPVCVSQPVFYHQRSPPQNPNKNDNMSIPGHMATTTSGLASSDGAWYTAAGSATSESKVSVKNTREQQPPVPESYSSPLEQHHREEESSSFDLTGGGVDETKSCPSPIIVTQVASEDFVCDSSIQVSSSPEHSEIADIKSAATSFTASSIVQQKKKQEYQPPLSPNSRSVETSTTREAEKKYEKTNNNSSSSNSNQTSRKRSKESYYQKNPSAATAFNNTDTTSKDPQQRRRSFSPVQTSTTNESSPPYTKNNATVDNSGYRSKSRRTNRSRSRGPSGYDNMRTSKHSSSSQWEMGDYHHHRNSPPSRSGTSKMINPSSSKESSLRLNRYTSDQSKRVRNPAANDREMKYDSSFQQTMKQPRESSRSRSREFTRGRSFSGNRMSRSFSPFAPPQRFSVRSSRV